MSERASAEGATDKRREGPHDGRGRPDEQDEQDEHEDQDEQEKP